MLYSSLTFTDWKELLSESPDRAADTLLNTFAEIAPQTKRAAIASTVDRETLIAQMETAAQHLDEPLAGVPYMLKDLFDVAQSQTHAGSTFISELRPTPRKSSPLHNQLQKEHALYCGKTQLNEFAYGLSGENPHYGDCPHPHVSSSLSGGSSSGSAWAVGKGLVPFATGTDTAGSVRVPAAFCGIFGMRLCPNSWSKEGIFPLAESFDSVGWFTHNANDMRAVNNTLITGLTPDPAQELRLLYCTDYANPVARGLKRGYDGLAKALGATTDPETHAWLAHCLNGCELAYGVLQSIEAYQIHRQWFESMRNRYDPVVWNRINRGRTWSEMEIEAAREKRREIIAAFKDVFAQYDGILIPVTPAPSPPKAQLTNEFRQSLMRLNTPASMARLPTLSIPVPLANRLSGGMQVIFPNMENAHTEEVLKRSQAYLQA